ncbi:sce7725 family protein [Patulibacter americanus]|uniref:sce7725 family protein n=1 Tax=Patulibacter americanus TaxID=588672 RepID=UPI0003B601BA|nr:sce7725 family protein [Patulibacter americanus]
MSTYFPIFRGKQFELIAIREFARARPGGTIVHPIIEPVRDPSGNTGLARTITSLEEHGFRYTVIVNPAKGDLADRGDAPAVIVESIDASDATIEHLCFGVSLRAGGNSDDAIDAIRGSSLSDAPLNLIYDKPTAGPRDLGELRQQGIWLHVAEAKSDVRSLNAFPRSFSCVQLDRTFKRLPRNTAYVDKAPSVFCNAHLYFEEDGFVGISDFLTIGDDYSEGGGLPLALVIHLTYQDPADQLIYIRHFCSTSNEDQSDPGGKFLEAVSKLVAFIDDEGLDNPALEQFRAYHREQRFPGLGVVKKLSMQNHLYVMDDALS